MTRGRRSPARGRRSTARLAGVQALYEMEVSGAPGDAVLREFLTERWARLDGETEALPPPDEDYLRQLVCGTSEQQAEIDGLIRAVLAVDLALDRLEVLLRAILRAGTWELKSAADVPVRVVINEYVDVAHAFFEGKEVSLVNAVLDRLARTLRPEETAADSGSLSSGPG